jgi:signal transduction histidine kinase
MAVQRYDVRRSPEQGGGFEEKFWSCTNTPLLADDGSVELIMHRAEDVTEYIRLQQSEDEKSKLAQELLGRNEAMSAEVYTRAQEIQKANSALRVANTELGRLDKLKTEFFSNISHEFRTPLTLMIGPLEDLLSQPQGTLGADERRDLELAHRNALRLFHLVNSLLEFSRIEAGRVQARFTPTNLPELTSQIASAFCSTMAKAGIKFTIDCPPMDQPVFVDREMWEKIVLNLISNAFKHTFSGEITVSLAQKSEKAELVVKDTGGGIPEADQAYIFDRFRRVEGAKARSGEGAGIGLSLVRELCRLHQGDIGVASQVGKGSAFTVSIPLGQEHLPAEKIGLEEVDDAHDIEAAATPYVSNFVAETEANAIQERLVPVLGDAEGVVGARILLADDNADMRSYIVELLRKSGFGWNVRAVSNGVLALEAARGELPDIVVSDIMMPEMDGYQLVKEIRADPGLRAIPVILLSARAGESSQLEGLERGADDYVVKPFSARELVARVRTHLALRNTREKLLGELAEKNLLLEAANKDLEAFSYSVAHDLRNPLKTVRGFSNLLLEEFGAGLPEDAREYATRIDKAGTRMESLVQGLLQLSKIGRSDLKRRAVDVSKLVADIVAEFTEREPERPIRLAIAPNLTAFADDALLAVALENLISNAWKFTRHAVDAEIRIDADDHGGETVFCVSDNGAGFDMSKAARLFDPFQRLHSADQFEGIGIGLATVQRVIGRHGGRIWAESAVGEGTTFYFTLSPTP